MRVLLAALLASACAAPVYEAPVPQSDPSSEASLRTPDSSPVAPELLALYERREEPAAADPDSPSMTGSPLVVRDGRVLVECAAQGEPGALATALAELGMTDTAVFQRMVSGWLPIDAIGDLEQLENLRFARPAVARTRPGSGGSYAHQVIQRKECR